VKPELKEYKFKKKTLNNLIKYIQETVSTIYISWTYDCDIIYNMLITLQMRLKSKKDVRRMELINKLIKLRDNLKT
jgi:hypothetical protein